MRTLRRYLTDRRNTDIFLVTVRVLPVREEILVVA
jgi:hypothetical protein